MKKQAQNSRTSFVLKLKLLLALIFITPIFLSAQDWKWANSIGLPEGTFEIKGMAKLSNGEIAAIGTFNVPTLTLGSDVLESSGNTTPLLYVMNSEGEYRKAIKFAGEKENSAMSIASDNEDNIYVAGFFSSLSFVVGEDTLVNQGLTDGYVLKFDKNLNLIWSMSIASVHEEKVTGIELDDEGNIYLSGQIIEHSEPIIYNAFLTKIAPDKTVLWSQSITSSDGISDFPIQLDNDYNAYLGLNINSTVVIDTIEIEKPILQNGLVLKFNPAGNLLAHKFSNYILSFNLEQNNLVLVKADLDTIYGELYGVVTSKYNPAFEEVWNKSISANNIFGIYSIVESDSEGNLYVYSLLENDTIVFAQDTLITAPLPSPYIGLRFPIYIFKYDKDGNEVWAKKFGERCLNVCQAILVYGNDDLVIAGSYQSDSIVFDDIVLKNESELISFGFHGSYYMYRNSHAFISRFVRTNTSLKPTNTFQTQLYPNPVREVFNLVSPIVATQKGTIDIYDISGILVRSQGISPGENTWKINVRDLANGMHVIHIQLDGKHSFQKLVKH